MPSSGGGDGCQVDRSISGGGQDASGGPGRLPDGTGLPRAPSKAASIYEHDGEPDEAVEEAIPSRGGVPQPQFVRSIAGSPADRGARVLVGGGDALLQHGERESGRGCGPSPCGNVAAGRVN